MNKHLRKHAEEIFRASLAAVDPEQLVRKRLKFRKSALTVDSRSYNLNRFDRILVIGAGKASAAMARGVEHVLGDRIDQGIVVVKYGHAVPLKKIRVLEAAHPVPDAQCVKAARDILDLLSGTGKKDLVICLTSGGGSALLDDFQAGITLRDVQKATSLLLSAGSDISEINTIRKHISRIKGGRLAAEAAPSAMINLILSDVIGDDLNVIASGPTYPDSTTFSDAIKVVKQYGLLKSFPRSIIKYLRQGVAGRVSETPKHKALDFKHVNNLIVGNNRMAVARAASRARKLGYHPLILTTRLKGEARETAKFLTAVAREVAEHDRPVKKPACLLAGGESTVTIRGKGKGGRNQEMALAAALEISACDGMVFLSGGTDGTDGPTDAAGAMVDGSTLARAGKRSMDADAYLSRNDSYNFFNILGGHVITGATLTNVMDLVVILVR